MKTKPFELVDKTIEQLSKIKTLDGYCIINYYTDGDLTVVGVYISNGLCVCSRYNQTHNDYELFDYEWDKFSLYTQIQILLEVAERYCL